MRGAGKIPSLARHGSLQRSAHILECESSDKNRGHLVHVLTLSHNIGQCPCTGLIDRSALVSVIIEIGNTL